MQPAFPELAAWANFYVISGSSAGALIGLQFVVITLLAQARVVGSRREVRAFGSPTVVHFCAALLISAMMSSPWSDAVLLGLCAGGLGAAGLAYSLSVVLHAKKQTGYAPDAGDWFWYVALPLVAYAALAGAGFFLQWNAGLCFALIAIITLLFLFTGIHNAWDTVTYVVLKHHRSGAGDV